MTTSTAPAAPAAPVDGLTTLLPHTIGTPEAAPATPEPTPEQRAQTERDEQFNALMQQNQQLMQNLNTLMQRPAYLPQAPQAPAAPPAPAEFTLDDLPDPVQRPSEFRTKLADRIRQRDQQYLQQFQSIAGNMQTNTRGAVLDNLYNRFSGQHADLAKRTALLQGAAQVEFASLQARGIDPIAVATQDPNSLIASIAQRMNSELGTGPAAPGGTPNGAPLTPGSPPTAPNAARTTGIAGGSAQPTTPRAPAAPLGFVAQLNKARIDSGLV